jgi:hypothetical protein
LKRRGSDVHEEESARWIWNRESCVFLNTKWTVSQRFARSCRRVALANNKLMCYLVGVAVANRRERADERDARMIAATEASAAAAAASSAAAAAAKNGAWAAAGAAIVLAIAEIVKGLWALMH